MARRAKYSGERETEMDGILCDELVEEIFRRLPPHSAHVSLVSKRWLRLYRSTRSTLSLAPRFPGDCICICSTKFLCQFPHLSSLSIATGFSFHPDWFLPSVAKSCPKLTHLSLDTKPISLPPLLSLSTSCPHLTSLSIVVSHRLSFHWLVSLHSLERLSLSFQYDSGVFERVDASSEGSFDDAELKLETLCLSGIRRIHRGFNWLWKSCKNLKKLQLECCDGIGVDMSDSSIVNCVKGLQEVELKCYQSILPFFLPILAENCKSLKSLLISSISGSASGEALLQFITRSCCNLQKLSIGGSRNLQNTHLLAIAEKFKGLSSLELTSCFHFTATGEGLKTISLAMSNELEELALIDCRVVGKGRLLSTLAQNLRNLTKLDLSCNKRLADKQFISMLVRCNGLRELKVRQCSELTNASLVSMFKSCEQLESVDILGCSGIEAEAVELFISKCLKLRQIHVEKSKFSDVSMSWALKKSITVLDH